MVIQKAEILIICKKLIQDQISYIGCEQLGHVVRGYLSNEPVTDMSFGERSDDRERTKEAARKGQLNDVVELSTTFRNDLNFLSELLIWSCREGHLDVVKWLVANTVADVNYKGTLRVANEMLQKEIDVHYTPLTSACHSGHLDVVKYLVELTNVDVNLPDGGWGYTPLIIACYRANVSVALYLLCQVNGLDVNIVNKSDGDTALHYAASCNRGRGESQLHVACIEGDVNKVDSIVIASSHMINEQDNAGDTPLHWACHFGRSDIVKTLMLAGADETITDLDKLTPAQVAMKEGHSELVKMLDKSGLWDIMQGLTKLKNLAAGFLVMLALQLMRPRRKIEGKKWCHLLTVIRIAMLFNKRCQFKYKRNKLKRKRDATT